MLNSEVQLAERHAVRERFEAATVRLRILYVGQLWEGGTCKQRMMALKDLGHAVTAIDVSPEWAQVKQRKLVNRFWRRLLGPGDLAKANDSIVRHVQREQCDILWLDKALTICPETLWAIKQSSSCLIVGYSPDDMYNKRNQSDNSCNIYRYTTFFTPQNLIT